MTAFAGSATLTFTGVAGTNDGGVYTGIYQGTLTGLSGTQNFMCDDYSDHISSGESWKVNTYNINDLSSVTFGTSGTVSSGMPQLQAYAEALNIAKGLLNSPGTGDPQASIDSFMIWKLLNNSVAPPGDISSAVSSGLANANSWWVNTCDPSLPSCLAGLSDVSIYVPVTGSQTGSDGRPQEFLGLTPTPEPVSMILMGTFLSLAGGLMGKKKRAS
jgi:hypothetical protein